MTEGTEEQLPTIVAYIRDHPTDDFERDSVSYRLAQKWVHDERHLERKRIADGLREYANGWQVFTGDVPENNMNSARRTVLNHAADRIEQGKEIGRGD